MKYLTIILFLSVIYSKDTTEFELDLDAMWENVIWEEIVEMGHYPYCTIDEV